MEYTNSTLDALEEEILVALKEKATTDIEIRRDEVQVKKINALANLQKAKLDYMKIQQEQQRIALEERRLALEEVQTKYNMASDLTKKADKIQRTIGKTMIGLFPESDKQLVSIMKAAQKITEIQ